MHSSQPLSTHESDNVAAQPSRVSRWFLALPPAVLLGVIALALLLRGDYRIATTLGIVQGLGEPLPISSSAHLIITPWLFGWNQPNAFFNSQTYDVALHIGTLLAFVAFFWRDWLNLLRNMFRPSTPDGRLFWLIALASVPGAAIGFVLDTFAADFFRDKYLIIAGALALMGLVLYYADRVAPQRDDLQHINWFKALLIGLAQSFAFVPGVSRSGSTMTMGRALGLKRETAARFKPNARPIVMVEPERDTPGTKRETAARFSFLMSMPITFGAGLLKLNDLNPAELQTAPFWLGIGTSFVVGALAIGFLLRYLRTNSFLPFVIYRVGLAATIVIVYLMRGGA